MMKPTFLTGTLLAFAMVVVGCNASTMHKEEHEQRTEAVEFNTVVYTDYDLNRRVSRGLMGPGEVIRITTHDQGVARTETGNSEVWVVLRNHTDHNYVVEARTQFFAQSGMPTDASPVWQRVMVPANSLATYREKSISNEPLQYRVEVRQAQ